jgi:hypothetical protein
VTVRFSLGARAPSVLTVVVAVLAVLVVGSAPLPTLLARPAPPAAPAAPVAPAATPSATTSGQPRPADLDNQFCNLILSSQIPVVYQLLGPACELDHYYYVASAVDAHNANVTAVNIITGLEDFENASAAATANVNATFQELLSYYEDRAEALVPEYLDQPWNDLTYAEILDQSGLVSSLEGLEMAMADQQYQIWNATAATWNAGFGHGGAFAGSTSAAFQLPTDSKTAGPGHTFVGSDLIAVNNHDFNATFPWEYWSMYLSPASLYGIANGAYFNLLDGGTVVDAPVCATHSSLCTHVQAKLSVEDVTTGHNYTVPNISYATYVSTDPATEAPIITHLDDISPFDTLRLWCAGANCSSAVFETTGAYFTEGVHYWYKPFLGAYGDDGIPYVTLVNGENGAGGIYGTTIEHYTVPSYATYACTEDTYHGSVGDKCNSSTVYTAGNATPTGVGTGSVPGNNSYFGFSRTAQNLVNDTMVMAYDYWLTETALTKDGKFPIPADCTVPPPSDAFPTATNFQTYDLSDADVEAVYLSYLQSVAPSTEQYVNGFTDLCGDPNLGLTFNWSADWHLKLNVTASVYIGAPNGTGLNLNGTYDAHEVYSNPVTWPVRNVDPTLLYPYEYDWDVPVARIEPLPANDPAVALLVNWTANPGYKLGNATPKWGVPTYLDLDGYGDYVTVAGANSTIPNGVAPQKGDAVYLTSCVYNNVTQTTCPLSATYFDHFAYGIIHFLRSSVYIKPPNFGSFNFLGAGSCGTGSLDSSIWTAWAGDIVVGVANALAPLYSIPIIGGALKDIGCFLGWVALIAFSIFVLWILYHLYLIIRPTRRRSSSNG